MVERDGVMGIRAAEDVPAVAAVVAALEEREGLVAGRGVAGDGVGVELPVLAGREAVDRAEVLEEGIRGGEARPVPEDAAVGRPPAGRPVPRSPVQAVGAAVHAPRRGERRGPVGPFGRSEHGRHVHGGFGRSELARGERKVGEHERGARRG